MFGLLTKVLFNIFLCFNINLFERGYKNEQITEFTSDFQYYIVCWVTQ